MGGRAQAVGGWVCAWVRLRFSGWLGCLVGCLVVWLFGGWVVDSTGWWLFVWLRGWVGGSVGGPVVK